MKSLLSAENCRCRHCVHGEVLGTCYSGRQHCWLWCKYWLIRQLLLVVCMYYHFCRYWSI